MDLEEDLFQYMLDVIICPVCRAKVVAKADKSGLVCQGCRRVYPMRDGIPIMLKEQATIES